MSERAASPAATLPALVMAGLLDAPLAALAWLLVERGVPVLVAGPEPAARIALLDALAAALPPARRPDRGASVGGDRLVRVAATVSASTSPGVLRAALAATSGRSGLAAAVAADSLAGVLDVLHRQGLTDDEATFLGLVLVLGTPAGPEAAARVVAAHYLRPVVRDAGGHPRRLGPAVLATWDGAARGWEDFSWGILPDLADRARMRAGDFEVERARREELLAGLAGRGETTSDAFATTVRTLRPVG